MRKDHDRTLGYIYFLSDGEVVKIGWTMNVIKRMSAIQTNRPKPLELLGTVAAPRANETMMHNRFHELRQHGEWFRLDPAITDYIDHLRGYGLVVEEADHREDYRVAMMRRRYHKAKSEMRLSTSR